MMKTATCLHIVAVYDNTISDFISWRYTRGPTGIDRACNSPAISLRGCAFKFL